MAVNQTQVDQIITAAAEEDPVVKMQNLQREVDLIKTSIKQILIEIRERMNQLENPFSLQSPSDGGSIGSAGTGTKEAAPKSQAESAGPAATAAETGTPDRTSAPAAAPVLVQGLPQAVPQQPAYAPQQPAYAPQQPAYAPQQSAPPATPPFVSDERRIVDEQLLAQFKAQLMGGRKNGERVAASPPVQKSRLQKVHKLFIWTRQGVQKYGHDRLEIMLQSYKTMGYISKESTDEIREIARLMPANIGDEHEVGPDEFVSELYTLNRIIAPDDTTLDRDMIEVMMEQRSQGVTGTPVPSLTRVELPLAIPAKEKKPIKEKDLEEDWMNLPDRI
jgi:hypothetical protein